MPPKIKITKEDIIKASIEIIRKDGEESLNARKIAFYLKCSTQPIFSNYENMEVLKKDVLDSIIKFYHQYIKNGMSNSSILPYKASGMYYIKFAKEEPNLFKLLFMGNSGPKKIEELNKNNDYVINQIVKQINITYEEAKSFHFKMWVFVHGIATMIITSYLDIDFDLISEMLTDVYLGLINQLKKEGRE